MRPPPTRNKQNLHNENDDTIGMQSSLGHFSRLNCLMYSFMKANISALLWLIALLIDSYDFMSSGACRNKNPKMLLCFVIREPPPGFLHFLIWTLSIGMGACILIRISSFQLEGGNEKSSKYEIMIIKWRTSETINKSAGRYDSFDLWHFESPRRASI